MIYDNEKFNAMPIHKGYVSCWDLINNRFELIEDNNIDIDNIDIDSIKEVSVDRKQWTTEGLTLIDTVNQLVRKYNELNREIKELKEK